MDDATQPSTQPYTDPRRRGLNNSGLDQQDIADIICILHPGSIAAHTAVAATAKRSSQHILQQDDGLEYDTGDTFSVEPNRDIALRFSSEVKNLSSGFYFGRNTSRCDIVLSPDDSEKKISNTHFRIYLKPDGILMLEDISTNGTIVDDAQIRRDRKGGAPTTQMLVHGSIIQVIGNETSCGIKFIVRIPSRDEFQAQYNQNLVQYLNRIRQATKKPEGDQRRDVHDFIIPQQICNSHGMRWNGGSKYNVTGQIGKGAFATVYKLATKNDGALFACKELDKRRLMKNNVLDQKVDSEMRIMRDLEHPNIVRFHDYHDHENRWIYIIMEYVGGGELSSYLSQMGKLPEQMVKTIARQVLHALQYLHSRKITHRDIKPDNILISSIDPLRVKLSDFGLSKVVQEETFMKTFCGTLLYCAPEVYPEYEDYKRKEARKRRRLGDPLPKTSPYDQSVDMWSFGAVLFHILCGVPPYMGRGDDRGAQMLRNIMTTDADFNGLRREGVSEEGIDFISKLLNRDPKARPKESACFKHPWLVDVPDEFDYMDIDEADEEEVNSDLKAIVEVSEPESSEYERLDASGIDLNDVTHDPFEEESEVEDPPSSEPINIKRPRVTEEQDGSHHATPLLPARIPYPSLPNISSYDFGSSVHLESTPTGRRLFGEVTPSVLRNTGALDPDTPIPMDGPQFQREFGSVSRSDYPSSNGKSSSHGHSLHTTTPSNYLLSEMASRFGGSASSLMGAESLVGNLNMGSDGISTSPNSDNAPLEEEKNEMSSNGANGPGDGDDADMENGSDDEEEQVGRHSRVHPILSPSQPIPNRGTNNNKGARSLRESSIRNGSVKQIGEFNDASWIDLACTIDERTGKEIRSSLGLDISHGSHISHGIEHHSQLITKDMEEKGQNKNNFAKPPTVLGKLTPVLGSITDQTIFLDSRMTSWGRGAGNTIRYPDPMDTRIPTYALELTFWAPAIESRIGAGEDWTQMSDVVTIVSTKTSKRIWINDVELQSETPDGDAYLFGKVYTGDVITIYRSRDEFLRYRCEFFHGNSAQTRPADEDTFMIERTKKIRGDASSRAVTVSTVTGGYTESDF
ncbi:calcium/calmodulin-dependent protein kinase type IV [Coccidioides immitis RMSCC 2394]|uniref:Calcium/calmodulin-dependent protein kinase type IV n=1 Tax=Coccidioides immitis RMSCC 2394 TaxID=404692 RepID=A0A0J6Y437_COCIT|nr:calcium/calmodulin-dependent protein kinase type IV [Coccidioides immitis RMSCC 2394]